MLKKEPLSKSSIVSPTVIEVEKRNLDCNSFPELADKKAWKEDWIKEYEDFTDHLRVSIRSKEYRYWINNEAY